MASKSRDAERHLFTGHFGAPKPVPMTKDRAEMHLAAIRVEQLRRKSKRVRKQARTAGSTAITIAARELGCKPDAVVAKLRTIVDGTPFVDRKGEPTHTESTATYGSTPPEQMYRGRELPKSKLAAFMAKQVG